MALIYGDVATSWALATRKRAPWHWITPPGLVGERGTAVRLRLRNALSPLLDPALLEATVARHFEPLLDAYFDPILGAHYPRGVRFVVNGRMLLRRQAGGPNVATIAMHFPRKRKPAAVGWLMRHADALPEDRRGIAISTFGKVIKRGWDWLGLTSASADTVTGLIEAPGLAASLTLNKADFLRSGPRGAVYLAHRKALQEAVSRQLMAWGEGQEAQEKARPRAARPVERDVETVLLDLADRFPLLATLVERRSGGQRKLQFGGTDGGEPMLLPPEGAERAPVLAPVAAEPIEEPSPAEVSSGEREPAPERAPTPPGSVIQPAPLELPTRKGRKRPTRLGLTIQFESRPDDAELGRLVETTVWVNNAHPAYVRAAESRAEAYHIALSVAMALAKVAVEPAQEHGFVAAFLSRWGEAGLKRKRK